MTSLSKLIAVASEWSGSMTLRLDPLTVVVVCVMIGGIVNLVAMTAKHDMNAEQTTKSSLCIMCWETEVETSVNSAKEVDVKVDIM